MTQYTRYLKRNRFVVFLLHGVISKQVHSVRNYTKKHLVEKQFVQFLQSLRQTGNAISMPDILEATRQKEPLPPNSFAITFDDGFANNYHIAAPILADFKIPATFYVTQDFVEVQDCSWIDQIEAAVQSQRVVRVQSFSNKFDGIYSGPEKKIQLLSQIRAFVKTSPKLDPYEFAKQFLKAIHAQSLKWDPALDQKMTPIQIKKLDQDPLFTVGGHGKTHRILSFLTPKDLKNEIEGSIQFLQKILKHPLHHYSYPEGLKHCYNLKTIQLLKKNGIQCCPSAVHGINRLGDSLFDLKRVFVV